MKRARDDDRTLDFFEIPQAPAPTGGSLDYEAELCSTLTDMITDAMKRGAIRSRYDLAARMSELTGDGEGITKAMIDSWTAGSKGGHRFPFQFAAAMESACDSHRLQELLGRKRGSRILVGEESLLAELGRLDHQEQEIKTRRSQLRKRLKGQR